MTKEKRGGGRMEGWGEEKKGCETLSIRPHQVEIPSGQFHLKMFLVWYLPRLTNISSIATDATAPAVVRVTLA